MPSSGILRCVALVKTNVLEECSASIISVTRIDELGPRNTLAFLRSARLVASYCELCSSSSILVTLMMKRQRSSKTSVLTGATRRYIPKDGILRSEFDSTPATQIQKQKINDSIYYY
jgi:hypothetical protein